MGAVVRAVGEEVGPIVGMLVCTSEGADVGAVGFEVGLVVG